MMITSIRMPRTFFYIPMNGIDSGRRRLLWKLHGTIPGFVHDHGVKLAWMMKMAGVVVGLALAGVDWRRRSHLALFFSPACLAPLLPSASEHSKVR